MTLFVSDLHLGRGTPAETAAAERDAVALLRAAALGPGDTLVLLGDVYDQYIEYRHLVPKTGFRLAAAVADLADGGVRVLYVVGNRDPWHLASASSFWRDLGAELLVAGARVELEGHAVWVEHGDAYDPGRRRLSCGGALAPPLHRFLRRPWVTRLYRTALPGDAGYGLAKWVAARAGTDGTPDPTVHATLTEAARRRLDTTSADLVVHGHSHTAACVSGPSGTYLNPGYWFGARTYARLDRRGPALATWPAPPASASP